MAFTGSTLGMTPGTAPVRGGASRVRLLASLDKSPEELKLEARELALQAEKLRLEVEREELTRQLDKYSDILTAAEDDQIEQVLQANEKFVKAMQSKRMASMKRIWSYKKAMVVHAGKPAISGVENVLHSFKGIFQGRSLSSVKAEDAKVVALAANVAVVTCTLEISGFAGMSKSKMIVTNVFEFNGNESGWLLIEHHCSPILFPSVPKPRPDF